MSSALGAKTDVIDDVIATADYPTQWPFSADAFARIDSSDDRLFYSAPRFVRHIDDAAINALTLYYGEIFGSSKSFPRVLDLCSSWISHYPESVPIEAHGLGMVREELERNNALTGGFVVQDLNKCTQLPYEDSFFDIITCTVSIDYLIHPREVLSECLRVLKPGGRIMLSFSNRMFPTKATALWRATDDADHVWIVGAFLHYAAHGGAVYGSIQGLDLSPSPDTDPLYMVQAKKEIRAGSGAST